MITANYLVPTLRAGCIAMLLLCVHPALFAEDLTETVALAPTEYRHRLVQQLGLAEDHKDELLAAIRTAAPERREAVAFLLVHMPECDLLTLTKDYLLANVDYAYKARAEMPWGKAISDELFFSDVLPYANVTERRDDWRKDFYERFAPLVKDCRTPGEAAVTLNKEIFKQLKVKYHPTKRPKPDQSPYESTKAGYASCTGLSVLLVDACRAVCVPARVAGTPMWTNHSGNHTWVEVWDRQWRLTGAAEPAPLDQAWFVGNAAQADGSAREHRIYAVRFAREQNQAFFPMVWAPANLDVPAEDVTPFYTTRRNVTFRIVDRPGGEPVAAKLTLRLGGKLVAEDTQNPPAALQFVLAGDRSYDAEIQPTGGQPVKRPAKLTAEDQQTIEIAVAEK